MSRAAAPWEITASSPGFSWPKAGKYLADGDWHQASEKGWGAARLDGQGSRGGPRLEYKKHDQFLAVMYQARDLSGDARLRNLGNTANTPHGYFYTRKLFLNPKTLARVSRTWSFCWTSYNR